MKHEVTFFGYGRKAQCPPDLNYPNGKKFDLSAGRPSCTVAIPYPAPECGQFLVVCKTCRFKGVITAAGRPDDPVEVKVACKISKN